MLHPVYIYVHITTYTLLSSLLGSLMSQFLSSYFWFSHCLSNLFLLLGFRFLSFNLPLFEILWDHYFKINTLSSLISYHDFIAPDPFSWQNSTKVNLNHHSLDNHIQRRWQLTQTLWKYSSHWCIGELRKNHEVISETESAILWMCKKEDYNRMDLTGWVTCLSVNELWISLADCSCSSATCKSVPRDATAM